MAFLKKALDTHLKSLLFNNSFYIDKNENLQAYSFQFYFYQKEIYKVILERVPWII